MDFLKIRKFKRSSKTREKGEKLNGEIDEIEQDSDAQNPNLANGHGPNIESQTVVEQEQEQEEEDDDDDFITNEVKRRLKELRKNSFMVLIPEEEYQEGEEEDDDDDEREEGEEGESSSREWIESEVVNGFNNWLCGLDSLYDKYCERMLFFDKMIAQLLKESETLNISKKSPKSSSKKLASALRKNLSFKRKDGDPQNEELDPFHQNPNPNLDDLYQTLETAYVAQVALSWEALHCQYAQLTLKITSQPENQTCYSFASQLYQQFQVLLQRLIETEPYEPGSRVEVYTRARSNLSKLLQVPNFRGMNRRDQSEQETEPAILATDLIKLMQECILTFLLFLKNDKKKPGTLLATHSNANSSSSLQQVQSSLDKKEMKVKELFKKKKGWKSKSWPHSSEEVELLFALIDIKVVSRVLRICRLSKEQLLWCEEKMSKLDLSTDNKLRRDGSPILFPC